MANKYIRHGETFCGNGTTSSIATTNGGVGAWNNINVLEGTAPAFGALAAGDVVYIRSKDNAGANITRTLSASATLGSTAGTIGAWVTWILDAGTVWTGINGILTYSAGSSFVVGLTDYNRYISEAYEALVIYEANSSANGKQYQLGRFCTIKNALIDLSFATLSGGAGMSGVNGAVTTFDHCHFKYQARAYELMTVRDAARAVFISPDIELLSGLGLVSVFPATYASPVLEIFGGQLRGNGANSIQYMFSISSTAKITTVGFQFPRVMPLNLTPRTESMPAICCLGMDSGVGAILNENWGTADSRNDNFYPTLNAFLPNSTSTPWAWKIYPSSSALTKPVRLVMNKLYTDSPATKTIGLEVLVASTMSPNLDNTWIDVSYIDDSTGLTKYLSSQLPSAGALTTSSAAWTATTYGPTSLVKKSMSVTTPTTIKKDTPVMVTFRTTMTSSNANEILFACPDVTLT